MSSQSIFSDRLSTSISDYYTITVGFKKHATGKIMDFFILIVVNSFELTMHKFGYVDYI